MSEELKLEPCPFCRSVNVMLVRNEDACWHKCNSCDATGPLMTKRDPEDAPHWNTRTPPQGDVVEAATVCLPLTMAKCLEDGLAILATSQLNMTMAEWDWFSNSVLAWCAELRSSFKAGDEEPRAPVCVLCGSRNADPRGWDLREPVCPDCQDRRSPTTHKAGS